MADLDRSVMTPRRPGRQAALVIIGTTVALLAHLAIALWALRPPAPDWVTVVHQPMFAEATPVRPASEPAAEPSPTCTPLPRTPTVLPPTPPPTAGGATFDPVVRACPPPRRDAPRGIRPDIPAAIDRVTASPSNAGWIAAWNGEHVYVSTDAGRRFERVLDGPGVVSDVGFDCFGTVIVVRERQLGLRVDGDERWLSVPGVDLMDQSEEPEGHAVVVSGGPEVIVMGRATDWVPRVARSSDLGRHWRYHDVTDGSWQTPVIHGRQHEDGTIAITMPATDCGGDGIGVFTVRRGRATSDFGGPWPEYGTAVELDELPRGLPDGATWAGENLARLGPALYRLRANRATKLPIFAESDHHITDAAGRLWTVVCNQPIIAGKQPSGVTCPTDEE